MVLAVTAVTCHQCWLSSRSATPQSSTSAFDLELKEIYPEGYYVFQQDRSAVHTGDKIQRFCPVLVKREVVLNIARSKCSGLFLVECYRKRCQFSLLPKSWVSLEQDEGRCLPSSLHCQAWQVFRKSIKTVFKTDITLIRFISSGSKEIFSFLCVLTD